MSEMFRSIAKSVKQGSAAVKKAVNKEIDKTKIPPHVARCSGCRKMLQIPVETFNWKCGSSKCQAVNGYADHTCVHCNAPRPKSQNAYPLMCGICNTVNTIYWQSGVLGGFKSGMKGVAQYTQEEYNHLSNAGKTFHCEHCKSELQNPNANPKNRTTVAEIICAMCGQVTRVPNTNFSNEFRQGMSSLNTEANRAYYYASNTRYANCPRCKTPNVVPTSNPGDAETAISCSKCFEKY